MDKTSDLTLTITPTAQVKDETRDKFNALLKQALDSKSRKNAHNQSAQKLISDCESLTNSNETLPSKPNLSQEKHISVIKVVEVDVHGDFEQDNFILNKFLNDSSNMRDANEVTDNIKDANEIISLDLSDPNVMFIKSPVPCPRKSKKPSVSTPGTSSMDTYKSISSTVTKDTVEPKTLNESKHLLPTIKADRNGSVYTTVSKTTNDQSDSILQKATQEPQVSVNETLNIKSSTSQSSGTNENEKMISKSVRSSESNDKISEKTELHFSNDQIRYENEVKPKHKRKESVKLTPKHHNTFKDVKTVIKDQKKTKYTYEKIIGIVIHKADRLRLDSLVIHPVVKIHIVDCKTGTYLPKSDQNRSVVFYYENKDVTYITPVISEPYNLYERRSLCPAWEEILVINEDINFILENENNTIIFFEIIDFVSFSVASSQFSQNGSSKGWHKIAWAFFKPLGKNNVSNVNKKARLQLYYPGKHKKVPPHVCDIFHWWSSNKLLKYPASLYISVVSVTPPEQVKETLRSRTPIHGEKASKMIFETNLNSEVHQNFLPKPICSKKTNENTAADHKSEMVWSRSSYQVCKLPNKLVAALPTHEEGCLIMKFSNNGLYLASAVLIDDLYSLVVFSVRTHEEVCRYSGHQGLIYDIDWSIDDKIIITASADCTACVWNFTSNTFVDMLPHPSYVYASAISSKNIVATGCYDQIVRIWCTESTETSHNLLQELEGFKGYVTSLCFNKRSTVLYGSDSTGMIIEWKYNASETIWNVKREINLSDLRDTIINQILLHTTERRLLIHARDNTLRLIDLKTGCVLHWLEGLVNSRIRTTCSFSPCGSFIFAGSENGFVNVWNSDLGQCVATYTPYDAFNYQNLPVHCVQFHPHDNILAMSHYGHNFPVLLVVYHSDLDGNSDVGLKMLQGDDKTHVLQKKASSKPLSDLQLTAEKIIKKDGDEKKQGKIKLEDVIQKIEKIVSVGRPTISDSSRSSVNN